MFSPGKTEATQRLGGCMNDLGERCWQDQWPPPAIAYDLLKRHGRVMLFSREMQVLGVVNRRASDFLKP